MENSKVYKDFLEQLNATGTSKMDGYNTNLMEQVYEWEKDEIEDIIWDYFHNKKDTDMAIFLPKLKKYNGINELKTVLEGLKIPSDGSVLVSQVLYEYTEEEKYLDIIMQNIESDPDNVSMVATLSYCKPSERSYKLLVNIYINSNNKIIRSTAVTGLLYNKGIIKNPSNLQEVTQNMGLKRKFLLDNAPDRKKIIEMLESGRL